MAVALVGLLGTSASAAKARAIDDLVCSRFDVGFERPAFVRPEKFLVRGSDIKVWVDYGVYSGRSGKPQTLVQSVPMPSLGFRLDGGPLTTFGADPSKRAVVGTIGFSGLKAGMHRIEIGIIVLGHPQYFNAYCVRTPGNFTASGY